LRFSPHAGTSKPPIVGPQRALHCLHQLGDRDVLEAQHRAPGWPHSTATSPRTTASPRILAGSACRCGVGPCPQCYLADTVLHDASGSDTVRRGIGAVQLPGRRGLVAANGGRPAGWAWCLPAGPRRARCTAGTAGCRSRRPPLRDIEPQRALHGPHELGDRATLEAQRRSVGPCPHCDLAETVPYEVPADRGERRDSMPGASRLVAGPVWLIVQSGIMALAGGCSADTARQCGGHGHLLGPAHRGHRDRCRRRVPSKAAGRRGPMATIRSTGLVVVAL
jgi:hypothetical protein